MAYLDLDTQWSKQVMGIVAGNMPVENKQPASSFNNSTECAENSNFQIARRLNDEKSRLINLLSQFPVTALWLLNEYEQKTNKVEQDDEATQESELTTALADIKKQFNALSHKALSDGAYAVGKQNLVTALQLFPFSFHDLTKLVDVIVYAYKFRGLCYQPTTHGGENKPGVILKRLEGLNRRNSFNAQKWSDISLDYDEQFLFLSSSDMHKYFSEVVF